MHALGLIQIGDIHFRSTTNANPLLAKKSRLFDAFGRSVAGARHVVVLIIGDVAYSGLADEYQVALDFFLELGGYLKEQLDCNTVEFCSVPGNHDCDFSRDNAARRALLQTPLQEIDGSLAEAMTVVQEDFFDFAQLIEDLPGRVSGLDRLYRRRMIRADGRTVVVNLLNTAWTSQRREQYGKLAFPSGISLHSEGDLVLTALHHPYAWLNQADGHVLRAAAEKASDFIVTGHIHSPGMRIQHIAPASTNHVLECGALQGEEGSECSFFSTSFALDEDRQVLREYREAGDAFLEHQVIENRFQRNEARSARLTSLDPEFQEWLDDPGYIVQHPRLDRPRLDDFFVYPNLVPAERLSDGTQRIVRGSAVPDILRNQVSLLTGISEIGRTSLLKALYKTYHAAGLMPVLLSADDVLMKGSSTEQLINRIIRKQYGEDGVGRFFSLAPDERVLLVDDVHLVAAKRMSALTKFIQQSRAYFGTRVLSATPEIHLYSSHRGSESAVPPDAKSYMVKPLSHRARRQLIEKWILAGRSEDLTQQRLDAEVRLLDNLISETLNKTLAPPLPFYIILMLQVAATHGRLDETYGAYNQLYQSILFSKLAKAGPIDTETMNTLLGELAWDMHGRRRTTCQLHEAEAVLGSAISRFRFAVSASEAIRQAERARVLRTSGDRVYFAYPFVDAFFVAQHISSITFDDDVRRGVIRGLMDKLHLEQNASIIVCLVGLKRDKFIIQEVLDRLAAAFASAPRLRLEDVPKKVGMMIDSPLELTLPSPESIGEVREQMLLEEEYRDHCSEDGASDGAGERVDDELDDEDEFSDEVAEMVRAFRLVQVAGQLLRAFSGAFDAGIKADILTRSSSCTLRTLSAVVEDLYQNRQAMFEEAARHIRASDPHISREALEAECRGRVVNVAEWFIYLSLNHLVTSTGSPRVRPVIADALSGSGEVDELIRFWYTARLDAAFPVADLKAIMRTSNPYTKSIARTFVWGELHAVRRPHNEVQRIAGAAGLPIRPSLMRADAL